MKLNNTYYIMRHGRSQSNVGHWHCAWPEKRISHLIPEGEQQAKRAGDFFKKHKPDFIFASDLTRTRQTAGIVSKATGVPIIFDKDLREQNYGIFNFKPLTEYFKYLPTALDRFYRRAPGGTTYLEDQKKIVKFFKKINSKYKNKTILIVSHMGPLWLLEAWIKNRPPKSAVRMGRAMLHYGQYKRLKN